MTYRRHLRSKRGKPASGAWKLAGRAGVPADLPDGGVDTISDKLLSRVFGMLSSGHTLLDVLPLVCKRWHRVARDPASWAGVRLRMASADFDNPGKRARANRILLHAPAAKSLTVTSGPGERELAALRRTRVQVDTVHLDDEGWAYPEEVEDMDEAVDEVASFLLRQRDLRVLSLLMAGAGEERILPTVAKLPRLQELRITFYQGARYEKGMLAGVRGLPQLRKLTVLPEPPRDRRRPDAPRGLVGELVRVASKSLRVLVVDVPLGSDLTAVLALRGLEHVQLNVYKDEAGNVKPMRDDAVRGVEKAFELMLRLDRTALRSAAVSVCSNEHARYSREMKRECRQVAQKFAPKMPGVALTTLIDGPVCSLSKRCLSDPQDCPGWLWPGDHPLSELDWKVKRDVFNMLCLGRKL